MRMIIKPVTHLCKTFITLILIILWPVLVNGETIISDNFDSCTINCTPTAIGPPNSAEWTSWNVWEIPATVDGVTHYSAEITAPGRGGKGKSMKMWKAAGVLGDYSGLNWLGSGPDHWFIRYYIKIPTAFSSSQDYKFWRFNTNSGIIGKNEIYLNYYNGTWAIYDGGPWVHVLTSSQYESLRDGKWHCVEFEIGLATKTLRLWVDGVLKYEDTNRTWVATGNLSGMQHFFIGNTFDHTGKWQSGWQAIEVDDFFLSTSYVGPFSGGANSTKQPTPPFNLQLR